MDDKRVEFTVKRKSPYNEDKSVSISLRLNSNLKEKYDEWAIKTNRSRNELMTMALEFAIEHIKVVDEE